MIRLGQSTDGRLVLGSNEPFPADIKHIEYYKEQRLFSLVFDTPDEQSSLMPCEICPRTAALVHASPNIMIIAMAEAGTAPYGYMVPLVQIGV
jgi:hypothetical protein